jgi:CheY-like chemotaxis protein
MPSTVFVKVAGFRDAERHALNTVFRLSMDRATQYQLWSSDLLVSPQLVILDVDSYEGGMELASPTFNKNLKLISVGQNHPEIAWRHFSRPMNWMAVVQAMDQLFTGSEGTDFDFDTGMSTLAIPAPGVRASLLIDVEKSHRMYLRARLALAGFVEVQESTSSSEAMQKARVRNFDLVIVNLDHPNEFNGWKLTEQLLSLEPAIGSIVLSTRNTSWHLQERAELAGCRGVLDIPFDPVQVQDMLRKI